MGCSMEIIKSHSNRNAKGMKGRLVVDALEWKLTLTKVQGRVFLNKIRVLQRKYDFLIKQSLLKIRENILWETTQTDFMNCEWQAESHKKKLVCI